jgi:hypothetical protein
MKERDLAGRLFWRDAETNTRDACATLTDCNSGSKAVAVQFDFFCKSFFYKFAVGRR